jgi:molybdate transport system substrate-binding protein
MRLVSRLILLVFGLCAASVILQPVWLHADVRTAIGKQMKVLSALAVQEVLRPAITDFKQASGQRVDIDFGTMGTMQTRLGAGETADIAILAVPLMQIFVQNGLLIGSADLARTDIGVAIRAGAAAPDISTTEAFVQTLLNARSVALTDPAAGGTAGVYLAGLLERLGIAGAITPKTVYQRSGFFVSRCVADGEADIGITLISEIVPVEGAALAGPLPAPLQNSTTYAAGIFAASPKREAALAFIAFLRSPAVSRRWKGCGFVHVEGQAA